MVSYDEHLQRALTETPDIQGESNRFSVPDPQLRQEGNVTVYENFPETVGRFDREAGHVLQYLQNELGTSAHIDESGRARLTGAFNRGRIAEAIDEYADRFVLCSECGLADTRLVREQGALVVRCEACGALSSTSE